MENDLIPEESILCCFQIQINTAVLIAERASQKETIFSQCLKGGFLQKHIALHLNRKCCFILFFNLHHLPFISTSKRLITTAPFFYISLLKTLVSHEK